MISDKEFLDNVWNKYYSYEKLNKKEKFFKRDFYIKQDIVRMLSQVASSIFIILTSVGVVYASSALYEYVQQRGKTYYEENMSSYFEVADNEMYYKMIDNYDEYLEYKNKWNNIIDISETDFEKNFLIVIIATWRMPDISIKDVNVTENTLYINVDKNLNSDAINNEEYMVSTILPNELKRDKIILNIYQKEINSDKYLKLESVPLEYNIESAKNDNCVVVVDNQIDSVSKQKIEKFISATNNKESDYIRIATYQESGKYLTIYDIQYENNIYTLYIDYRRSNLENKEIQYIGEYEKIAEKTILGNQNMIYLENIFSKTIPIIIYNQ